MCNRGDLDISASFKIAKKWTTSSTPVRLNLNVGIGESARRAFVGGNKGVIRYGKKPNPQSSHFPRRAGEGLPNRLSNLQ
jgi:hypothetical protein